MATPAKLPVELIVKVADNFEDMRDLATFRLISPRIHQETANVFANRLQGITWLVSRYSLLNLAHIVTDNAAVAAKLRALRLGSHYISLKNDGTLRRDLILPTLVGPQERDASEVRYAKYVDYSREQGLFWVGEKDLETLTKVIRRLASLEHVEVTDGDFLPRDLARKYNIREQSHCFGADAFAAATGKTYDSMASPYGRGEQAFTYGGNNVNTGLGYNFGLLLCALGATERPIQSMRIWHWDKKHNFDYVRVHLMPRIHVPGSFPREGLARSLANLTTLSLMLKYVHRDPQHTEDEASWSNNFLPALVNLAPRLQRLSIVFDGGKRPTPDQEALVTAFSHFARSAEMPCLQLLDLRNATIRYDDLLQLWTRVRSTIAEVRLHLIGLVDGTWAQFFRHLLMPNDVKEDTTSRSKVRVDFSWLVERTLAFDSFLALPIYRLTRIVVFDPLGLATCWTKCLNFVQQGLRVERHRRCRHVSFFATLVLGEAMEAGSAEGIKTLLGSTLVTPEKMTEFWLRRPQLRSTH